MAEIIKPPTDEHGHEHEPGRTNPNIAWEKRDINPFQVTAFGIGLAISCVIVAVLMWGLFDFLYHREEVKNAKDQPAMMKERNNMQPPEPRLQANPRVELRDLRESENQILENYGWLDPDHGTVRIPIEQAIEMVARKGLPSKPTPAGSANDGYRTIPEDSSGGRTLEKIAQ